MLCGARRPKMLRVLRVSVRRSFWAGEGRAVRGVGLGVMSHRRLPSRRVSWRVSCRHLRTYGWSWGAGTLQGWTPHEWSASASMASLAACGIQPPAGWRWQFSTDPLAGPLDQALEGGLFLSPISQLPELRVGPALPLLFMGGAVALGGGGVGVALMRLW